MLNKCVKLILILALVVAVAFGVSFLPFSLSDKFKQVAEKVTSHIKGLAGLNRNLDTKLNLDFSKRDNYKLGEFNVVFDRVNNVPKEGFHKFVHKGENDKTLDVEKFFNGETELEGLEGGLFDYAAAYFKGDTPHLLLVELGLHEEEKPENADKAGEKKEGEAKAGENKENAAAEEKKGAVLFFAPGENNKWVKLPEGANLGEKVEEVFNVLAAAAAAAAAAAPANGTPEGGNGAAAGGAPPAEGAGAGATATAAGPTGGAATTGVQAGPEAAPGPAPTGPVPAPAAGPNAGGDGGNAKPAAPAAPAPQPGNLTNAAGAGAGHGDARAEGVPGPAGPQGPTGGAGPGPNPPKPEAAKPDLTAGAVGVNQGTTTGQNAGGNSQGLQGTGVGAGGHGQGTQASLGDTALRGTENNVQSGGNSNGNNQGGAPNSNNGDAGHGGNVVSSGSGTTTVTTSETNTGPKTPPEPEKPTEGGENTA